MIEPLKRPLPSSTLRTLILDGFYRAWERHSDPNDYLPAQQVWNGIYARQKRRVDAPLVEGAFNGLLKEEFLSAIQAADRTFAARITDKGRSYREELLKRKRTEILAYLGAVTGMLSLLWNVISKVCLSSVGAPTISCSRPATAGFAASAGG